MKKLVFYVLSLFSLIVIWQIAAWHIANPFIFPNPVNVFNSVIDLLTTFSTYQIIVSSILRLFISISIALISGIIFGFLGGLNQNIRMFLTPYVSGLRSLPVASLIAIILILFASETAIFVIGFLVLFPIIYEATKEGIINIDKPLKDALRLEPSLILLNFIYFYIPLAYPYIKTGILQSIGLGFKVLVMAEFIAQTQNSIGRSLNVGRINFEYDTVFAWTIIIIIIVFIIEISVNKLKA